LLSSESEESDELGTTGQNRRWGSVVAVGALIAMVLCAMVSFTPPLRSVFTDEGVKQMTGLSALDDCSLEGADKSLGFPIYFSDIGTTQSTKRWIIEFGGTEQDIAQNKNKVAEAFGDKVVFKGIKLHMLVVEGTHSDLKLHLKDYKPGEIEFAEQDAEIGIISPQNDTPATPESSERRLGECRNPKCSDCGIHYKD